MENEVRLIDAYALIQDAEDVLTFGMLDRINREETIEPDSLRPKGRWVDPEWNDMWQSMTATCSHCLERGEVRVRTNEYGMKVINSPCCPNCGAKMEG